MNSLAYRNFPTLSSALSLGWDTSAAAAYNPATTYAAEAVVTYLGKTYVAKQGSNTGNAPDAVRSVWWVHVDATTGIPVGAIYALMQCETQPIRWRDDGVAPTNSLGIKLPITSSTSPDNTGMYNLGALSQVKIIEAVSGAIASVTFYGN